MKDLFETPELIPANVQTILNKYIESDGATSYDNLKQCLIEVEKIGYTFEYDMDGAPFNLTKI